MYRRTLRTLALFLLLISIAHAQPTACDAIQITNYWNLRFGSWPDICMLGMLISFFIISALYMISHLLGKPGLAAWCKKEIFQIAITGMILAGIFGFMTFTCTYIKPSLLVDVPPGHTDDLFEYSKEYVRWLRDTSYKSYVSMSLMNSVISGISMTYVRSSPGGFGIDLRPLQGLSAIGGLLSFSMNSVLIGGVITSIAHLRMLKAVEIMMFNILLPVGLVCRCFEPIRRFGGSLIAIALGFYLFYPFLLIINAGIIEGNLLIDADVDASVSTVGAWDYVNELSLDVNYHRYMDAHDPSYLDPNLATEGPGHIEMTNYANIFDILYDIALYILIAALFLPLFNFILLIAFIRNLSQVLGEEVDVSHLTRMI
ncbi:MAG: hypothetical protein ABIG39_02125 [Candidatus Micrarchaeota archaeon]